MKVLQAHNYYRVRGGEKIVMEQTTALLRGNGHRVELFTRDSRDIASGWRGAWRAAAGGVYSRTARDSMRETLRSFQPDLVHVHNVHPLISPSALAACRAEKVPVVMTCHNFRLVCPAGILFSHNRSCHRCLGGREYWCVLRNCKENPAVSISYALRNWVHRRFRLFRDNVTHYITLSHFQKNILAGEGFPEERISILPNMIALPEPHGEPDAARPFALFVGRLSVSKGITVLLDAARRTPAIPIRVAADTSNLEELHLRIPPNVELLGRKDKAELDALYARARFVIVPSVCYEACPMVVLEAMAQGRPVVASRTGSIPELVSEGETGLLFEAGNAADCAEKMKILWDNPAAGRTYGRQARERAARNHNPEQYYQRLLAVYQTAMRTTHE